MGYKLLIFFTFLVFMFIAGYYVFRYLNEKIKESNSWQGILVYAILLFTGLGVLLAGGLFILVKVYSFLTAP